MREGGYVRYDGRRRTQVLRDCAALLNDYSGSLSQLHERARNSRDLEDRLLAFYGVGPVTMNIFLRESRPFWLKADPDPLPVVEKLKMDIKRYRRKKSRVCQGGGRFQAAAQSRSVVVLLRSAPLKSWVLKDLN